MELKQDVEPPARNEDEHARKRTAQADELGARQPVAQEKTGERGHDQRRGGGEEGHVGSVRRVPRLIDEGIEAGNAQKGHEQRPSPLSTQEGQGGEEAAPREGQDGDKGDEPAPERDFDGGKGISKAACGHEIAAPYHGGEQREKIADEKGRRLHGTEGGGLRAGAVARAAGTSGCVPVGNKYPPL